MQQIANILTWRVEKTEFVSKLSFIATNGSSFLIFFSSQKLIFKIFSNPKTYGVLLCILTCCFTGVPAVKMLSYIGNVPYVVSTSSVKASLAK